MSLTFTRAITAALAAVTLLLLLFWAFRPDPGHGATGNNDPTAGQVFQVAVDTDTSGNPTGSGGLLSILQSTTSNIPIDGNPHFIDVIVDEVHATDGMGAFGFSLAYDPNVVKIVSKNFNSYMLPGAFEIVPAPIPDQTGLWRIDAGQLFANVNGEGVLVRIGLECVGNGTSVLDLGETTDAGPGDGIPNILKPSGAPITVTNDTDGEIVCGTGVTPTPSITASPTASPIATATTPPSVTATASPTATATTPPSVTATATPTATGTTPPSITATPTATATATPTPTPVGQTPSPTPTPTPVGQTPSPTPTATAVEQTPTPTGTVGGDTETPIATPTPTDAPGTQVVWGDANCSGSANPVDSLLTLRFDAGLGTSTGDCPDLGQVVDVQNASPHSWGDVDCSGEVTPVDSLKLLRYDAGLGASQGEGCPGMGTSVTIVAG